MDEHRRMLLSALAVLAFLVSALSVGIVLIDDADAAGTWDGGNPSGSSAANPYDSVDIDISGTNVPVLSDVYVAVGASVSITGCTDSWSHGSSNYTYNFTSVTSGYGLSVSTSGDTSVSGTISKAGNITVSYHYVQGGNYPKDENRSFVIHAVEPDDGGVQSIKITGSISSGSISTGGSITLTATTSPSSADNRHVDWSISSGSQYGEITSTRDTSTGGTCVVKGSEPGRIVVLCESEDGYASETFVVTVTARLVTSIAVYQGFADGEDLIVTADVSPSGAYNTDITWSVVKGNSLVTLSSSSEYSSDGEIRMSPTHSGGGEVTLRATAADGAGVYKDRTFYVGCAAFDANGGSNAPSDVYRISSTNNMMGYLPDKEPTRSGYAFMGWCTDKDGSGMIYNAGGYASLRDGTTYYAIWGHETKITFNVLYGTGGPSNETVIVMDGETDWFYIPNGDGDIPTRPGYTFLGWSDSSNASTAKYEPGSRFEIEGGETYDLYDVWTITENEYHLAYDANGGINPPTTQNGTNYGTESEYTFVVTSSEPTRESHRFLGWSTTSTGGVEYEAGDTITVPIGTKTLYAVWQEIHVFKIAYDANGGTGAPTPTPDTWETTGDSIQIIVSSVKPTWDEFHRFLGWSTNPEATTADIPSSSSYTLTQTGTTTLYAVWEEIEGNVFTLHFDLQGGLVGPEDVVSVTVRDETTVSVPADVPTWDEYRLFLGWAVEADSDTVTYQPGAQITLSESDTTLYAVWQRLPMPWTLHFELGGGSWGSVDQTGTSAEETFTFTIPDVIPALDGFGFRGWAVTDGGSAEYQPGDAFIATEQNTTLYAVWEELDLFTLHFDVGDGSPVESLTAYSLDSCRFVIPSTIPALDGYLFQGWATVEGGAVDCQPGQTITVTSQSTTIHAVWIERPEFVEFTLSFDVGEGSGGPSTIRATTSELSHEFTIPSAVPTLDGHGFLGWSLSVGGDVDYEPGDRITVSTPATTLHAVWIDESQLNTFTLNFSIGDGVGDFEPMIASGVDSTHTFVIPSDSPTRSGFVFMGWAVPSNPSEVVYAPGDRITVSTATFTLYAVWQPESIVFTLSFDVGDGASGAPATLTSMSTGSVHTFTIPSNEPSLDGYRFMGWSATYGGSADYQPGDIYVSGVRDATLYAVWKLVNDGAIHISNAPADRTDVNSQFTYEVTIDADVPFTVAIGGTAADWLSVNGHTIRGTPLIPGTYTLVVTVTDGEDYKPSSETFTIRVMESDMEYRVEFVTSGGSEVEDQWIQSGGTATAPADPIRDGFRFVGWYTQDGAKYDFSQAVGADMTLRAAWVSDGSSGADGDGDDDGEGMTVSAWMIVGVLTAVLAVAAVCTRNQIVAVLAVVSAVATVALYLL